MTFRMKNHLPERITGSSREVAFAICFWVQEDEDAVDLHPWDDVLAILKSKLCLAHSATWQDIYRVNSRKLAVQLELPADASWHDICHAHDRTLATAMELPAEATWQEIHGRARDICAQHLGLSLGAPWSDIYRVYRRNPVREGCL